MTWPFKPWEIPTGGKPPPIQLHYQPRTGRRVVMNRSAWMLLIRKADGSLVPLPRTGALLEEGDEVLPPAPKVEHVDAETLLRARMAGVNEYTLAHAPSFHEDGATGERFDFVGSDRWWWHRRELPHGRELHLAPASANARLTVSPIGGAGPEGSWCYPHHADGWRAALGWNGEGDPPDGWSRHLETGRRRHDGMPESEYVNASEAPLEMRARASLARRFGRTGL